MAKNSKMTKPYIMTEEQASCIASPIRRELVSVFQTDGPCSVSHVAATLGKPENATYYHVNRLVECGLLQTAGETGEGRERTVLYKLIATSIGMPEVFKDTDIVKKSVRSVFSLTERELLRVLAANDYKVLHDNKFTLTRASARLTVENQQKVMKMLWDVVKFAKENQSPEGEITAVTVCVAPVVTKKKKAKKAPKTSRKTA